MARLEPSGPYEARAGGPGPSRKTLMHFSTERAPPTPPYVATYIGGSRRTIHAAHDPAEPPWNSTPGLFARAVWISRSPVCFLVDDETESPFTQLGEVQPIR